MARCRLRVGVTAVLVALVMTGCAQDEAAPEVDPAEATTTAADNGDNGNGQGGNGNGGNGNGNGGNGSGQGGNGSGGNGGTGQNGPGPDDPVDQPTLSLPGLPIGGNTYRSIDGNHPDNQCANVNWIVDTAAADLAPGITVAVTGFDFDPDVFTVASAGCDDDAPPCPGFAFTADARVCNLAVAPIPGSDTSLGSYRFALRGRVDCREIGGGRCRDFKAAVAAEPGLSLGLDPPTTGTDDDSEEPDGDGPDTDGPDTDGTQSDDTHGDGDSGDETDGGAPGGDEDGDGSGSEGGAGEPSYDGTEEGSDTGSGTDSGTGTGE